MDRPRECRVLDISGAGIRLRTQHHMPVEEVVCLGFHEHVLVVRIRNVRPLGNEFVIGAERICSFPKEEFGDGQPTFEKLKELLATKGWDIEVDNAASVLPSPAPPPQRRRRCLPLVLAATLVALTGAGVLVFELFRHEPARQTVATPPPAERTPVPAEQPPPASPALHHVKIGILEPAWITASADGKAVLDRGKMFAKDGSFEFDFSKLGYVHLGNSRGVQVFVDGKAVSLPEPHAVVGVLELTAEGSHLLPWSNEDPKR